MIEILPKNKWLSETCRVCGGAGVLTGACRDCGNSGRVVRHTHSPESGIGLYDEGDPADVAKIAALEQQLSKVLKEWSERGEEIVQLRALVFEIAANCGCGEASNSCANCERIEAAGFEI